MFKRILLPLDGTEQSESICGWVTGFARAIGAEIELLMVTDPGQRSLPTDDRSTEQAWGYLHRRTHTFELSGVKATCKVAIGNSAEEIVTRAGSPDIDMIAMATRCRSALVGGMFGSVTNKVLRSAPVPVLTMDPHGPSCPLPVLGKPSAILVPLDGSEMSELAVPVASSLAGTADAEVLFVRVISPPYLTSSTEGAYIYPSYSALDEEREAATQYLAGFTDRARVEGVNASWRISSGHAAARIVEIVEDRPGTLIVMSTHGRSGFRRWVLGSVTERVIRSSGQPVLALPPGISRPDIVDADKRARPRDRSPVGAR